MIKSFFATDEDANYDSYLQLHIQNKKFNLSLQMNQGMVVTKDDSF